MDILRIGGVYQPPFNRQKTPSLSGSTNKLHVLIIYILDGYPLMRNHQCV